VVWDYPDKDGVSLRQHVESLKAQNTSMDLSGYPEPPKVPYGGEYVWTFFGTYGTESVGMLFSKSYLLPRNAGLLTTNRNPILSIYARRHKVHGRKVFGPVIGKKQIKAVTYVWWTGYCLFRNRSPG
jgi:hypothetical protein